MAGFTGVAILGSQAGVRLVKHVPQRALQRGFAVFLLVMGMVILYQNRGVVLPSADSSAGAEAAATDRCN